MKIANPKKRRMVKASSNTPEFSSKARWDTHCKSWLHHGAAVGSCQREKMRCSPYRRPLVAMVRPTATATMNNGGASFIARAPTFFAAVDLPSPEEFPAWDVIQSG